MPPFADTPHLTTKSLLSFLLVGALFIAQQPSVANAVTSRADTNSGKADRTSPPDPCQQALKSEGKHKGLDRRCEDVGASGGAAKGDFNGDGFADLAVGVPFENRSGISNVGGVNILYGSAAGITASADQFFDEATFGFPYVAGDHFGWALASGDFNGDGFSDLAIGMPDYTSSRDHGVVLLIDGSAGGLSTSTARQLDVPFRGGRMGAALVWADFNGDGFGDLAIGAPNGGVIDGLIFCSFVKDAGEVQIAYGSPGGLRDFGAQSFNQGGGNCGNPNIGDSAEEGDHFGSALAAGDFNGDGFADLAVGVPGEDLGFFDKQDAGMVQLLRGTSAGLRVGETRIFTQDTQGVQGDAETGDQFGRVLAVGDFTGDGEADLAVGVPFEDLDSNTKADAGAVHVFQGSNLTNLLIISGNLFITQGNLPSVGVEAGDRFGWSLAVGRFNTDIAIDFADLAIGSPGEDIGSIKDAGMVSVLYGTTSGPSLTQVQTWHQDRAGVPDLSEPGDQFGYSISAWNFGYDGRSDLAIGAPYEDIVSASTGTLQLDAGAVTIIYGGSAGLSTSDATPSQFWHQDSPSVNDVAQEGDRFGSTLY